MIGKLQEFLCLERFGTEFGENTANTVGLGLAHAVVG
jgi:hypothetical protein